MTESRSEDDDIEFDEQNIADDDESSNGDSESPTAEAVAKAFLDSVDKYVEYEETDQNHPESAFSPKNGMSGVVYVGQNGNYHHNSNGHAPSGLIADELESDENLQVLFLVVFSWPPRSSKPVKASCNTLYIPKSNLVLKILDI